jgi:hypothetical protein
MTKGAVRHARPPVLQQTADRLGHRADRKAGVMRLARHALGARPSGRRVPRIKAPRMGNPSGTAAPQPPWMPFRVHQTAHGAVFFGPWFNPTTGQQEPPTYRCSSVSNDDQAGQRHREPPPCLSGWVDSRAASGWPRLIARRALLAAPQATRVDAGHGQDHLNRIDNGVVGT